MEWKAVYTKPRHEKKVADRLQAKGIHVYCPVQTVLKQWSDRKKKVTEPVFRSYVFLQCEEAEELRVLQTQGVVSFVRYLRKVATIREQEIEKIRDFLGDYENIEIEAIEGWQVGDSARIQEGGMKGLYGELVEIKGHKARLILNEMGIQLVAEIPLGRLAKN